MSDPSTAIGAPKFAKAISKIKNVLINLDMSTTHRDRNWEHLLKLSFAVKAVVLALQRSTSFETLKLTCSSHNHSGNIVIQMLSPLSILRGVTIEDIAVRGPGKWFGFVSYYCFRNSELHYLFGIASDNFRVHLSNIDLYPREIR